MMQADLIPHCAKNGLTLVPHGSAEHDQRRQIGTLGGN
jgi:hypothetical protein